MQAASDMHEEHYVVLHGPAAVHQAHKNVAGFAGPTHAPTSAYFGNGADSVTLDERSDHAAGRVLKAASDLNM